MEVVLEDENWCYYKLYSKPEPAGTLTTEEQKAARRDYLDGLRNNPSHVVVNRKGDNEYTIARKVLWSKEFENCPDVKKEYEMGKMGVNPQDEGKSAVANLTSTYNEDLRANLVDIINAVNACK